MRKSPLLMVGLLANLMLASAQAEVEDISPKISFERTVCDLGQVGLGTKNSCEFRFRNTGQGPLKITATQKSIYVSSNDKANPNVRLTIKARVWRESVTASRLPDL